MNDLRMNNKGDTNMTSLILMVSIFLFHPPYHTSRFNGDYIIDEKISGEVAYVGHTK